MKKILFFLMLSLSVSLYGEPPSDDINRRLVVVAKKELNLSIDFLKLENYQQIKLYDYVKLVKSRYILTKELVWLSGKIVDAIYVQSNMIRMQEK